MAWPAVDDFSESNGTSVVGKSDDAGNTWSLLVGTVCTVQNDRLAPSASNATVLGINSATPSSPDYDVSATIYCVTDNNSASLGVLARCSSSGNWYMARYNTSGDVVELRKEVSSTGTLIATYTVDPLGVGDFATIKLSVRGSVLRVYWNGELLGVVTDTDLTAAGNAGFRHFGNASTTTGLHLDNFVTATIASTVQTSRPNSDVSVNNWTNDGGGGTLYTAIDDVDPGTSDYIHVPDPGHSLAVVGLQSLTDPAVSSGHKVRYMIGKSGDSGSVDMVVRLLQGSTEIARWDHPKVSSTATLVEKELSGGQADAITDYSQLRIEVTSKTFRAWQRLPVLTVGWHTLDMVFPCNTSSTTVDTGAILWCPVFVPWEKSYNSIGCAINNLVSGSTVRIALYDTDKDGLPTTLLEESGDMSSASTGNKSYTFAASRRLTSGWYWLGIQCTHAVGIWTVTNFLGFGFLQSGPLSTPGAPKSTYTYGAFPATAPVFDSNWSTVYPRLGLN